jgi:hypothetical protein
MNSAKEDYAQIEFVPTIDYAVIANGVKQSRNSAGDCHAPFSHSQ